MPEYEEQFCEALIQETKRRLFEESIPRLLHCLDELTEEEIWHKANDNSNSVGNLVLHLCGNARQWIVSGLGGAPDKRQREQEFTEQGPIPTDKLKVLVDQLQQDVDITLDRIQPEDLLKARKVQVFEENGLSILVHAIEHFSYHIGQITYYVKLRKNIDTGYYKGLELEG